MRDVELDEDVVVAGLDVVVGVMSVVAGDAEGKLTPTLTHRRPVHVVDGEGAVVLDDGVGVGIMVERRVVGILVVGIKVVGLLVVVGRGTAVGVD